MNHVVVKNKIFHHKTKYEKKRLRANVKIFNETIRGCQMSQIQRTKIHDISRNTREKNLLRERSYYLVPGKTAYVSSCSTTKQAKKASASTDTYPKLLATGTYQ
jgi:transcriptional regulator of heat shock response